MSSASDDAMPVKPQPAALAIAVIYVLVPTLVLSGVSLMVLVVQLHRGVEPLRHATTSQLDRLIEQTDEFAKTAAAIQLVIRSVDQYVASQEDVSKETADVLHQWAQASSSFKLHLEDGAKLCRVIAASLPAALPNGIKIDWREIQIPGIPNPSIPVDVDITWRYFDGEKAKLDQMSQSLSQARSALGSTAQTLERLSQAISRDSRTLIATSRAALRAADSHLDNLGRTTLPVLAQQLAVERSAADRLPVISLGLGVFAVIFSLALLLLGVSLALIARVMRDLKLYQYASHGQIPQSLS